MQMILAFLVLAGLSGLVAAGSLGSPSIILSSNVRGASTSATITFTTATAGIIKNISLSSVNFDTSAAPTSFSCTGNGTTANISAATVTLSGTTLFATVTTPVESTAAGTVVICTVQGLKNSAAPQNSATVAIVTQANSTGTDIDSGSATLSAITAGVLTRPSVILSSHVKASTSVSATIAFTVSSNPGQIKLVSVIGTNFDNTVNPTSAYSCNGLSAGIVYWVSSDLVLNVTTPATISASTAVTCIVSGLKNKATAAASSTGITITTATTTPTTLDTVNSVFFPAIFNAALVSPSIVLSSNVKATNVSVTVTFTTSATAYSISKITLAGVNFDASVGPTSAYICNGVSAGTVAWNAGNLLLTVDTPASVPASTLIKCTVAGLKNAAAAESASLASISTDAGDGAYVSFPEILASASTPASAPDNSKSSASMYEFSALLIALFFVFA